MRKQKSFSLWLLLSSLLLYVSCRKSDIESIPIAGVSPVERFFRISESADPRLKSIAQSIRVQENQHPFLEKFTKQAGWPVWAKAKVIDKSTITGGPSADKSALVYVPFVKDNAVIVNAVLAVRVNATDTAWRLLYANNYESFGFGSNANGEWNARNVFQLFALFQYDIFGHTSFKISDNRLFNSSGDSVVITLKEKNGAAISSRANRSMDWHEVTTCGTWEICDDEPPPAEAKSNRVKDCYCWLVSICNTYYWNDGLSGGGGTGWTGSSWTSNDGGGGSGSGTWANGDPCANNNSCYAGWTPSNSYVVVDGETYTTENYLGMNDGFPWLWWVDPYYDFVVPPPGASNLDLTDYLKCFLNDPSFTYKITVAVDQPAPGSRAPYTKGNGGSSSSSSKGGDIDVGHTFLILEQVYPSGVTVRRNLGFYPSSGVKPKINPSSGGLFVADEGHHFDVSMTTTVSGTTFMQFIDILKASQNESYNLNTNNCSTFCTQKLSQIGITLPETIGSWPGGGGVNPGDLGEDIRAMQLQSNQTRNTTGGTSAANNVTC